MNGLIYLMNVVQLRTNLATNIRKENPIFIPRNHLVEAALSAAELEDDYSQFQQLLEIVTSPFDERPGKENLFKPTNYGKLRL